MSKKTISELADFGRLANQFLKEGQDDKMAYALRKVLKQVERHVADYNDELQDIQVEHALERDGALVREPNGNFVFSRDGQQAFNRAARLLAKTEYDITPHYPTDQYFDRTEENRALIGFVISELVDDDHENPF